MKGCSALSPSAIGSIITALFWVPTSKVIKYLLSNENGLVLAYKSLKSHLPVKKKLLKAKFPQLLLTYFSPLLWILEGKYVWIIHQRQLSPGKCEQTTEKAQLGFGFQNHFMDHSETIQAAGCELRILVLPQIVLFSLIRLLQWKQALWSLIFLAIVK